MIRDFIFLRFDVFEHYVLCQPYLAIPYESYHTLPARPLGPRPSGPMNDLDVRGLLSLTSVSFAHAASCLRAFSPPSLSKCVLARVRLLFPPVRRRTTIGAKAASDGCAHLGRRRHRWPCSSQAPPSWCRVQKVGGAHNACSLRMVWKALDCNRKSGTWRWSSVLDWVR